MKLTPLLASLVAALGIFSNEACGQTYSNPVIRRDCPDPTILDDRARSGYFYVYSTQSRRDSTATASKDASSDNPDDIVNLPVYRSKNLVNWEFVADGFPENRPEWVKDSRIWAPDINYSEGQYLLYYALGAWAQIFREGSGAAVAESPCGPFRDMGEVVSFKSTGVTNSIDPALFTDEDGRKYLFWGKSWTRIRHMDHRVGRERTQTCQRRQEEKTERKQHGRGLRIQKGRMVLPLRVKRFLLQSRKKHIPPGSCAVKEHIRPL